LTFDRKQANGRPGFIWLILKAGCGWALWGTGQGLRAMGRYGKAMPRAGYAIRPVCFVQWERSHLQNG